MSYPSHPGLMPPVWEKGLSIFSRSVGVLLLIVAVEVLAGCASAPPRRVVTDLWRTLPEGQSLYLTADIDKTRDMLGSIISGLGEDSASLFVTLDRTDTVAASLLLAGVKPSLSFLASGDYPRTIVGWSMFWDRDWKKVREQAGTASARWWENEADDLQLSILSPGLIGVSNGAVRDLIANQRSSVGFAPPAIVYEASGEADIFLYVPAPAQVLSAGSLDGRVLSAISEFWAAIRKAGPESGVRVDSVAAAGLPVEYILSGALVLKNPNAARVYGAVMKLTLAAWMVRLGIGNLRTVQEQLVMRADGPYLHFSGLRLPEDVLRKIATGFIVTSGLIERADGESNS